MKPEQIMMFDRICRNVWDQMYSLNGLPSQDEYVEAAKWVWERMHKLNKMTTIASFQITKQPVNNDETITLCTRKPFLRKRQYLIMTIS